MITKELGLELKRDLSVIKKQLFYVLLIVILSTALIIYNIRFLELEKEIVTLSSQKSYMQVETLQLKKEISKLASPKRISKIAKRKLHMKKVDMSKVRFIEYK